jgi:hypothetical protein
MTKKQILLLFLLLGAINLVAQRSYLIQPIPVAPTIDGNLESESWSSVPITEDFTTTLPSFGKTPQMTTQVQIAYDERGVYIAAVCKSNKIRNEGSQRDNFGTGDYFSVGLDTWNDDQNAFEFAVNAAGQRIDIRQSSTLSERFYDTYWQVQTKVTVDGWTIEMFIPYTALRFPKQTEQNWGLQFTRYDRSTGETSTWNPQDPLIQDKVLQYGQLEGLKEIRQRTRLGVSVLNETNWDKRTFVVKDANIDFSNSSNMIVPAVDGRIGLGSSSTLDFSILPDYNLDQSLRASGRPTPASKISPALPRQAAQEESGIFDKSKILESSFNISEFTASRVLLRQPSDIVSPIGNFELLQKSRFTTRTKNNIGIGISNSIFSRPEYSISDGGFFSFFETVRLPQNPIYNNISIEKCFRNNSWIQISNGINFIDPSLWGNRAALSTQLRDKSNQFEVAGKLNVQSQGNLSVADGFIRLGKVNGKITYGAQYIAPQKTLDGLLTPFTFTPVFEAQQERFSAHLSKRNFNPTHKNWLNTKQSIQFTYSDITNLLDKDLTEFNLSWVGLNKKFQNIGFNFMFSPFRKTTFLDFEDIRLPQKQFFPIGFGGSFTTDERKKLVLPITFRNNWIIGSDRYNASLDLQPYWVLHRKWIFKMEHATRLETNQFIPTGISADSIGTSRFAENRNLFSSLSKVSLQFIPTRRLYVELGGQLLINSQFNRKIYELRSDGQINPFNYPIQHNPSINKSQGITAAVTWLINPYSQLIIRSDNSANYFYTTVGLTSVVTELPSQLINNNYSISFVWNIYRQ